MTTFDEQNTISPIFTKLRELMGDEGKCSGVLSVAREAERARRSGGNVSTLDALEVLVGMFAGDNRDVRAMARDYFEQSREYAHDEPSHKVLIAWLDRAIDAAQADEEF